VSRRRWSGLKRSGSNGVTLVRRRGRSGRFEPNDEKTDLVGRGDRVRGPETEAGERASHPSVGVNKAKREIGAEAL